MNLFNFFTGSRPALITDAMGAVDTMLRVSGEMLEAALACLLDNEPLQMDLSKRDQEVNESEQEVRRLVIEHLAIDPERERILSLILVSAVPEEEEFEVVSKDTYDLLQALSNCKVKTEEDACFRSLSYQANVINGIVNRMAPNPISPGIPQPTAADYDEGNVEEKRQRCGGDSQYRSLCVSTPTLKPEFHKKQEEARKEKAFYDSAEHRVLTLKRM